MAARELIGSGTYGKIYVTDDPKIVCKESSDKSSLSFIIEIAAMNYLKSVPYVIQAHSADIKHNKIYLPRYKCNLNIYIIENTMTLDIVRSVLYKVLVGLYHSHKQGIIHRDIKCTNIFVNTNDKNEIEDLVIGDWGCAFPIGLSEYNKTHNIQSSHCRSPEIMACNGNYTTKIDIWTVGCIFVEMITKQHFCWGKDDISSLVKIFQICGTPKSFQQYFPVYETSWFALPILEGLKDDDGIDLMKHLLDLDPITRFSCAEALSHKFFDSIRTEVFPPLKWEKRELPIYQQVEKIEMLSKLHHTSRYASKLAQCFYWRCVREINDDTNLDNYALGCLAYAALITDTDLINQNLSRPFMKNILRLIHEDLFGLKVFGMGSETYDILQPPRMIADYNKIFTKSPIPFTIEHVINFSDNQYRYRVIMINRNAGSFYKATLFTPDQMRQLCPLFAERMKGYHHVATFYQRCTSLLFRQIKL